MSHVHESVPPRRVGEIIQLCRDAEIPENFCEYSAECPLHRQRVMHNDGYVSLRGMDCFWFTQFRQNEGYRPSVEQP